MHSHGVRLGVVLILEKERRNFAVEDMGAQEHEHEDDDDDDYVSGTARARAAAAGIIGGWAEGASEMEGGRLPPSFSLSGKASDFFSLPPKKILNGNLSLRRRRGRRPP